MKLATAAEVLARGNVSSTVAASNTQAVDSALEAATSVVASILQTPIEAAERIDYFDYLPSRYQQYYDPMVLKLTQRFLTDDTVRVYLSTDGTPATISADYEVEVTEFSVNRERGILHLFSPPSVGVKTIAVKYAAGFSDGSSDIPSWMKEAAISAALHVHHAQTIGHNKDDQPDMSKVMAGILYTQLNHYITVEYGAFPCRDSRLL